ncbi:DgyrCDS2155 [Dimorphilus gyrociliatus]|uniref:DgyrCDS2155 n=1 Tax=Dimorphilus gyrociliatus TaxID=2664684 RepID=A0A7I8V9L5_9ANNE|nr:DgyrCDS2155 [Dimorphilus gyrociliatus]
MERVHQIVFVIVRKECRRKICMSFEPQVNVESTLIRFQADSQEQIKDRLQTFMKPYLKENKDNLKDCGDDEEADDESGCIVKDSWSAIDCHEKNDYGFTSSTPCVALTLNRIYGWKPEVFESGNTSSDIPAEVQAKFDGNHVVVGCFGENPLDKELVGQIQYSVVGFHKKFYPYKQQRGYLSPVVMIKFKNIREGVLVQVECKAYAKNIKHHRNDRAGSTHFEIISD